MEIVVLQLVVYIICSANRWWICLLFCFAFCAFLCSPSRLVMCYPAVTSLTPGVFVCRGCTRAQRKAGRFTARPRIPTAGACARWSPRHGTSVNETLGVDSYARWPSRCVCICECSSRALTFQWSALTCGTGQRRCTGMKIFTGLSLCFDTCRNTHEQTHTGFADRCIPDTSVAKSSVDCQSFSMPKEFKLKETLTDGWERNTLFCVVGAAQHTTIQACNCLCVCTCVRGYSVHACVLREGNKSDLWQKLMNYWTASSKQTFLNAFAILSLAHDGTFSHQRCSKPEHTNGNITKINTLFVLHWCCYILFSLHTKRERNEKKVDEHYQK